MQGEGSNELRANAVGMEPKYLVDGDPGRIGGNTYTSPADANREPTIAQWENIFGPAGRDVKNDLQRQKRHSRWHLPDYLRGPNMFLTDKIDGLLTGKPTPPCPCRMVIDWY